MRNTYARLNAECLKYCVRVWYRQAHKYDFLNTVASYTHTTTLSSVTVYGSWCEGWGCSRREEHCLRKTKTKMNGKSSNGWRKLETLLARYAASYLISLACLAPFLCECRIAQAIGFRLLGCGGTRGPKRAPLSPKHLSRRAVVKAALVA